MTWFTLEELAWRSTIAAKQWREPGGMRYPDARFALHNDDCVEAVVGRRSCNWWPGWGWHNIHLLEVLRD